MQAVTKILRPDPNFQVRGAGVTRVEAICDTMFGFAITLLIVTSGSASSYQDLLRILRGFPAFAFCFVILARIWYTHYQYHRRFGLEDGTTTILNFALMFVVLFFVFPLKVLIGYTTELIIWALTHRTTDAEAPITAVKASEFASLLEVFSGGFALISLILGCMYLHALRLQRELELGELEIELTKSSVIENFVVAAMFAITTAVLEWGGIKAFALAMGCQLVAAGARKLTRARSRRAIRRIPKTTEPGIEG